MALLADDAGSEDARHYFGSLGELASKIVQEAESIRNNPDWSGMNYQQKERLLDRHFVDDDVRSFYSAGDKSSSSIGAASATHGSSSGNDSATSDLPTWEMLFPRPIPLGGQKFVQVGSGEDGGTAATASYVDEFAGNFQWETKSQLELWLPEGKSLPSPRSVRKSMYKDESSLHLELKRYSKASEGSDSFDGDGSAGATSVKAMAKALSRSSGTGVFTPTSGANRLSASILAPIPSLTPSASPAPKSSPSLTRAQSTAHTKSSPEVAPKPPKRSSSFVNDTPSPRVKHKSSGSGVLQVPPTSKSASFAPAESEPDPEDPLAASGGKSPRPSPPVRRDSLSKKTGSTYTQPADAEQRGSPDAYTPGESTPPSSRADVAVTSKGAQQKATIAANPSQTSLTPKLEKPSRAPPPAPSPAPAAQVSAPVVQSSSALSVKAATSTPAESESVQKTPEPFEGSPSASAGRSTSAIETTFPASEDSPEVLQDEKATVPSESKKDTAAGSGFGFLSDW